MSCSTSNNPIPPANHVETATLEISGVSVDVWSGGSGADLLFLHPGSGLRDHAVFLRELSTEFRVTAPAHPGFHGSELPDSYTNVDDLAYFYIDLMDEMDLRDTLIVGSSFGGWIAAEIAIKRAHRMVALVLIDALGAKFGGRSEREILDLFSFPSYEQDRNFFFDETLRNRRYSECPQEDLLAISRNHESFARFAWSPTLYDPKLKHRLSHIDVPTLLIWGGNDAVVSTIYGEEFAARIPGAVLNVIENAGHYPHVEQPHTVVNRISSFSSSIARRSPI